MMQYKTFCYLQNHKTGCTFVEEFLRKFSSEPLLKYEKHGTPKKRNAGKFYFVNVREPVAIYRSLYAYGLEGQGTVYGRLKAKGLERFYSKGPEGFEEWLRFVTLAKAAPLLDNQYTPELAAGIGFMTWRFLRLAVFGYEQAATAFENAKEHNDYVKANYYMNAVLRQENLRDDLKQLVTGPLAHAIRDPQAALAWLDEAPKVNASSAMADAPPAPLEERLAARIARKERFLFTNFYPETQPA